MPNVFWMLCTDTEEGRGGSDKVRRQAMESTQQQCTGTRHEQTAATARKASRVAHSPCTCLRMWWCRSFLLRLPPGPTRRWAGPWEGNQRRSPEEGEEEGMGWDGGERNGRRKEGMSSEAVIQLSCRPLLSSTEQSGSGKCGEGTTESHSNQSDRRCTIRVSVSREQRRGTHVIAGAGVSAVARVVAGAWAAWVGGSLGAGRGGHALGGRRAKYLHVTSWAGAPVGEREENKSG